MTALARGSRLPPVDRPSPAHRSALRRPPNHVAGLAGIAFGIVAGTLVGIPAGCGGDGDGTDDGSTGTSASDGTAQAGDTQTDAADVDDTNADDTGADTAGPDSDDTDPDDDGMDDPGSDDAGPVECLDDTECDDPALPFCDPDSGRCVACVTTEHCSVDAPYCDTGGDDHVCRPCSEHAHCDGSACKIPGEQAWPGDDWGQCFDPSATILTVTDPAMLQTNLDAIAPGEEAVVFVDLDANAKFDPTVLFSLDDEQTVAIIASDTRQVLPGRALDISGGARVWLHRLDLRPQTGGFPYPLAVDDAFVHVQRSKVVPTQGGSVDASNGAYAHIENSYLLDRSPSSSGWSPLLLVDASATVLYSTLGAAPGAQASPDAAVYCLGDSAVDIRNSVVLSRFGSPPIDCAGATTTASIVTATSQDGPAHIPGFAMGEFDLSDPPADWLTTATWQAGDPPTDIYGTARPTESGGDDVVGAHVP